jgi:hypothetical protein
MGDDQLQLQCHGFRTMKSSTMANPYRSYLIHPSMRSRPQQEERLVAAKGPGRVTV